MNKNFWIQFAAAQMGVAGQVLQAQDANRTGTDDAAGTMLVIGGDALGKYVQGDLKGAEAKMLAVADGIYKALGKTPPQ